MKQDSPKNEDLRVRVHSSSRAFAARSSIGVSTGLALAASLLVACAPAEEQSSGDSSSSAAATYPEPRGYAQLVFHRPSGQTIMFGGESNDRTSFNDIWSYDATTNAWTKIPAEGGPIDMGGTTVAYDAESDRIIIHLTTRLDASAESGLGRISETWAFDMEAGRWTDMQPDPAPFGLMGARMVYDAAADQMILFGGADFTQASAPRFNGTWAYDYNSNTWTERHPDQRPPGRSYFGMAYDTQAGKTLIFGGSFAEADTAVADELWSYDYSSDSWERLAFTGNVPSDHHPFMVYAPGPNRTFYLVNESFSAFDYTSRSWTELGRDERLGIRHFHGMAFDDVIGRLVVFGGGSRGLQYDNQTWIYDPQSNGWQLGGPGQ